jgi:ribosomal protein S18 acetylase RimI-like enzyme
MTETEAITLRPFDVESPLLEGAVAVYKRVWGGDSKEYALYRHATYPGFKGMAAVARDGAVLGAVYGYTDAPGQWWHEHIAAVLGPAETARWLTGSFAVTELAVLPEWRRAGIARLLLRGVLRGLSTNGATLSTQVENHPARALYESEGWRYLIPRMTFGADPTEYVIMRRDLPL